MDSVILPDDHLDCIQRMMNEVSKYLSASERTLVVHLGAHMGEEVDSYLQYGFDSVILCEANTDLIPKLESKFEKQNNVSIHHCAIADQTGSVTFHVHETEKGGVESASILDLKELGEIVPIFDSSRSIQVPSFTLDDFLDDQGVSESIGLLAIDIQGAEKMALSVASQVLSRTQAVLCEVNLIKNYEGCAMENEIDEILDDAGFDKVFCIYHELYRGEDRFPAWGECLWIKRELNPSKDKV